MINEISGSKMNEELHKEVMNLHNRDNAIEDLENDNDESFEREMKK